MWYHLSNDYIYIYSEYDVLNEGEVAFTNVILCGVLAADTKPNDVFVIHGCRDHMQFPCSINCRQQLLIDSIGSLETEADESKLVRKNTKSWY
jgi:hypothetical protein